MSEMSRLRQNSGTSQDIDGSTSSSEGAVALIEASTSTQLASPSSTLKLCEACCTESTENFLCDNCSRLFCDSYTFRNANRPFTRDHQISNMMNRSTSPTIFDINGRLISGYSDPAFVFPSRLQSTSPPSYFSQNFLSTNMRRQLAIIQDCDIHKLPQTHFCDTCHVSACDLCITIDHSEHKYCLLDNIVEDCTRMMISYSNECKRATLTVEKAIQDIGTTSRTIDENAYKACKEAREYINRVHARMLQQLDQQIQRLDSIREVKQNNLVVQENNLRKMVKNIQVTEERMKHSLKSINILDLIKISRWFSLEMERIRCFERDLEPCENDNFAFQAPNEDLVRAMINHIGNLNAVVNTPLMFTNQNGNNMLMSPDSSNITTSLILSSSTNKINAILPPLASTIFRVMHEVAINCHPKPCRIFGREGNRNAELCRPWGVCCDEFGRIIVADRSNNRVQVFNRRGEFLTYFGRSGKGPGEFDRPAGIAVNRIGRIVVCDKDNHRVQVFHSNFTFMFAFGRKGGDCGEFNYPWDVACNCQSQMVVSDTRNHRVQLFSHEGQFLAKFGFENTTPPILKHFDSPRGVCFNPQGKVIVTDFNNHRVIIVDSQFKDAQYMGVEGMGEKEFLRPQGIICDDQGNIVVADSRNNRLQAFDHNGKFLWQLGHAGTYPGQFDRPCGLALTPDGNVAVVDFGNTRIQIF